MNTKITTTLIMGVLILVATTVFAGENYNSSRSNTSTAIVNQQVGDILLRYGIGGAEINQVTDALEQGIAEEELRSLLADIGVSEAGTTEVLAELDRLGASVQAQTGGTIQIPAKGKSIAPAGTEEGTTPAPTKDYNTTRSNTGIRVTDDNVPAKTDARARDASSDETETPAKKWTSYQIETAKSNTFRIADTPEDTGIEQPISIQAREVRGWDPKKKKEFLQTVKTHAEIKSQQDLDNFAKGVLVRDENIEELEIAHEGLKMKYRMPAKFLGIFPVSLAAKVEASVGGKIKVRYPWFRFFFSKPVSAEDIQTSIEGVVEGKTQASRVLESISVALNLRSLGDDAPEAKGGGDPL